MNKVCIACELGQHQVCEVNRNTLCACDHREIINASIEAQRLADVVVDAAIKWHLSDMKQCMDKAEVLEKAVDKLLEFRRTMPIVKLR